MTSGNFHAIPVDSIYVDRSARVRRTISDLESLKDSIRRLGLIHPIVITREGKLVAGERRLNACRQIGWTSIHVQYTDELDDDTLEDIEIEENVKRLDFSWQEVHERLIQYDKRRRAKDPTWSAEKTANVVGLKTRKMVEGHYILEKHKNNPLVKNADNVSTAINTARRLEERAREDETDIYLGRTPVYIQPSIIHADFLEWSETYDGPKFNFIHCDFPYGIDSHNSAQNPSGYNDSPTLYWNLLRALSTNLDSFCASSAHMIFWFSPTFYCQTWELLKLLDGFKFDEVPLIWMKDDHRGVAPDTQRRPRRVYEMAFFGWRGDRKLVRMKDNIIAAPTERERHPHEKSETALQYFFEMVVDEQTSILDPTCGSGSAIKVAQSLGARHSLGIEKDEEHFNVARRNVATGQRAGEEGAERDDPTA